MFDNDRDYTKANQPPANPIEEKKAEPVTQPEHIACLTILDVLKLSFVGILSGCLIVYFTCKWVLNNTLDEISLNYDLNSLMNSAISIPVDTIDPVNNGQVVLVTGILESSDILQDKHFGVSTQALQLVRLVELYQVAYITERRGRVGNDQRKRKTKVMKWDDNIYPDDKNPAKKEYGTQVIYANELKIGKFRVLPEVLYKIAAETNKLSYNNSDYKLFDKNFKTNNNPPVADTAKGVSHEFNPHGIGLALTQSNYDAMDENLKSKFKLIGTEYAIGDLNAPNIGDYRIGYRVMNNIEVTMIGIQSNDSLDFLKSDNTYYKIIRTGKHTAQEMMHFEEKKLDTRFYIARFFQWLFLTFGIFLVLNPLRVLKANNSFIGKVARIGIMPVAIFFSLLIVGSASLITIIYS